MNKHNFSSLAVLILACLVLGISCSKSKSSYGNTPPPPPGGSAGNTITISSMTFSPASLTVKIGAVVKWNNNDGYAHTATSDDGGLTFDSGDIAGGGSYSYTTVTAGTFDYHCKIHGLTMAGTLIVSP